MSSCEDAKFYYEHCGLTYLDGDGDGDGIHCENLCNDLSSLDNFYEPNNYYHYSSRERAYSNQPSEAESQRDYSSFEESDTSPSESYSSSGISFYSLPVMSQDEINEEEETDQSNTDESFKQSLTETINQTSESEIGDTTTNPEGSLTSPQKDPSIFENFPWGLALFLFGVGLLIFANIWRWVIFLPLKGKPQVQNIPVLYFQRRLRKIK